MTEEEKQALLDKYYDGTITPEEKRLVDAIFQEKLKAANAIPGEPDYIKADRRMRRNIPGLRPKSTVIRLYAKPLLAAAATMLIAGLLYYLFVKRQREVPAASGISMVKPGGNKAILTLASGEQITLDSLDQGEIRTVEGMQIEKSADGKVSYRSKCIPDGNGPLLYNTISTPAGGQYEVFLPDGSHVYLNAATTLRFPMRFSGVNREVYLSGEAYFEIAHDKTKPFYVFGALRTKQEYRIKVTGTHFNVRCYPFERNLTTLAQGGIQIYQNSTKKTFTLTPGDQATVSPDNVKIERVDPSFASSWTQGIFSFQDAKLKEVLAYIGRWYDVKIDIDEKKYHEIMFSGELKKNYPLQSVLKIINRVCGTKLIVTERRIIIEDQK